MKSSPKFLLLLLFLSFGCNTDKKENSVEKWKKEIIDTENEFSAMSLKEGIPKAFMTYAADDVVLSRNNNLIVGKSALQEYYNSKTPPPAGTTLTWKPDFVNVSSSGDLGYTYGKYVYKSIDSLGMEQKTEGIFHTVWKKQPNGSWRFVWD